MFKGLHRWLPSYLVQKAWSPPFGKTVDVMLCVVDHFEPLHHTDKKGALDRISLWNREFPRITTSFRDADGVGPRHTFFYPVEQYDPDLLNGIQELCAASGGEVEIHLHHDNDTPKNLADSLNRGVEDLRRHGFLPDDRQGRARYGFVHGNWALDNSHPGGRHCGVNNELEVLESTGCYADFTLPSAPNPAQTKTINQIYYAEDTPLPKSHDAGERARVGRRPEGLLLVQGPLGLNWKRRKWGLMPRIENADLTGANPPRMDRMNLWLRCGVTLVGRPEWVFIKLHTHGAIPRNSGMLLGDPIRRFHEELLANYNDGRHFRIHYVSARELVNIVRAAEDEVSGNPGEYRDYHLRIPGRSASKSGGGP